jgi:ubiquinone/menaquinone biosynthesis C-methylase UbiE
MTKLRFSDRADAYAAHRPGYPQAAIDALLGGLGPPQQLVVADVGAGTGISTNLLAQRVGCVVAIEPNAAMRRHAELRLNVRWEEGRAEELPMQDKSVDVAAAFQAFHWFDADRAFGEFVRVARRRIAMLQYERDETHPFCASYAGIVRRYATDDTEALRMRTLEVFATLAGRGLRRTVVPFKQKLTAEGLLGRVDSSSYLPRQGTAAIALREEIHDLFDRFARDGFVEMAMNVYVLAADVA